MTIRFTVIGIIALSLSAAAKGPAKSPAKDSKIINDAWYTMQAGNTPSGFFHEVIEEQGDKLSYRYSMTRVDGKVLYQENIGALAKADLTPVAFNLNKSGSGATETTNATYSWDKVGGMMSIEVQGSRVTSFRRHLAPYTILDVFFPVWLTRNWSKLRPGYKGWIPTFAEDPEKRDFRSRNVKFEVKGVDHELGCLRLHVELEDLAQEWCQTEKGSLVDLVVGRFHVRKVSGESEAKAFMSGVMPK
jgi:hypothetical protein